MQPIGLLCNGVLLVFLRFPVLPPILTLAMLVVTGGLRTLVLPVHIRVDLSAMALAPVIRKPVLHAVTEGPLTLAQPVNSKQGTPVTVRRKILEIHKRVI